MATTMAQAILGTTAGNPVYLGVWTNWSLGGRVTGSTITMTHRNGALLTALLALFVTFSGSRLWRIACFALHQWLIAKSDAPQDGLYHQRQMILRNAPDSTSGSINLSRSLWAWRLRANRPLYRLLPVVMFCVSITVALAVASLFSSRISSAMKNEVLISSPHCGVPGWYADRSPNPIRTAEQYANIYDPWVAERINSYANYAQRCYSNNSTLDTCMPYVKRMLASNIDRNTSCPFRTEICRHKTGNIMLDTGYLNSQEDLGINSPLDLQFNLRFVTHCAPLTTMNRQEVVNYSQDKAYTQYFLGAQTIAGNKDVKVPNFTFEAEQQSSREIQWRGRSAPLVDYSINTRIYKVYNKSAYLPLSTFVPIPELVPSNGDSLLVSLSANGFRYNAPVDDDWYAAHQRGDGSISWVSNNGSSELPYYLSDEPASVLGCQLSYQTCDPTLSPERGCIPLGGSTDANLGVRQPRTRRDRVIYWVFGTWYLNDIISTLKSSALTSRFRDLSGFQPRLPVNQWQMEVENWHNITLAALQALRVDTATGPGDSGMLQYFWASTRNAEEEYLCKNQKIISTAYTNFSMLWLMIVLVIGLFVVLLEFFLESIVVFLEHRGIIKVASQEWFSNNNLQLQRMCHEELGLGGAWDGCTGPHGIPVTEKGKLLAVLDRSDPNHPILVNPFKQAKSNKQDNENINDAAETSGTDASVSGSHTSQSGRPDSDDIIAANDYTGGRGGRTELNDANEDCENSDLQDSHRCDSHFLTGNTSNDAEQTESAHTGVDRCQISEVESRESGTTPTEMAPNSNSSKSHTDANSLVQGRASPTHE